MKAGPPSKSTARPTAPAVNAAAMEGITVDALGSNPHVVRGPAQRSSSQGKHNLIISISVLLYVLFSYK